MSASSAASRSTIAGPQTLNAFLTISTAGSDGGKWSRLLEVSRLIRSPERITVLDPSCKVATFQVGPLGLVLGPADQQEMESSSGSQRVGNNNTALSMRDGKGLRVRKFQAKPPNPDGTGGGPMQAELSGIINVGDILVAVNGVSVSQGLTAAGVVELLKRVGRPVKVSFRTPANPPPPRPPATGGSPAAPQSAASPNLNNNNAMVKRPLQQPKATRPNQGEDSYTDLAFSAASSIMDTLDPEVVQGASQATKALFAAVGAGSASAAAAAGATWLSAPREAGTPPPIVDKNGVNMLTDSAEASHAAILCADDDFVLPTVAGEVYEAVLSAQMHGFQRTRMADGGIHFLFPWTLH
jgi:hypothetical protein